MKKINLTTKLKSRVISFARKLDISYYHFYIYSIVFLLGVFIMLLLFFNLSSLCQGIITNLGAGLMITSLFAFWIDRINNINKKERTKEKQKISLRRLEVSLYLICRCHIKTYQIVKEAIKNLGIEERICINQKSFDESVSLIEELLENLISTASPISNDLLELKKVLITNLDMNKNRLEKELEKINDLNIQNLNLLDIISNEDLLLVESLSILLQETIDGHTTFYYKDLFTTIDNIQQRFGFSNLPTLKQIKDSFTSYITK